MKKILLAAAALILFAGLGIFGYSMLKNKDISLPEIIKVKEKKSDKEIGVMKPVETPADMMEELGYEITQNSDTIGWIKIPNTNINNSVLQSHNNVYYLRLNERKQQDVYGCYFADYDCSFGSRDKLSPNTIIYGHSDLKDNPDGPRFSQLFKFTDEQFAKDNPYIYFSTLEDYMAWQVFAVYYTDTKMNYIQAGYSEQELDAIIKEAKQKSLYNYECGVSGKDKILTLSTCSVKNGELNNQRFVIMAKLIPIDEPEQKQAVLSVNETKDKPESK